MWKIMAEPERPQMTLWSMRIACCITQATYPLRVSNAYCFSTATIVERTGVNVNKPKGCPITSQESRREVEVILYLNWTLELVQ
jgi:hypothetical protein